MRILIAGGDGMLGHRLMQDLSVNHDVAVTLRRELAAYDEFAIFDSAGSYELCDARDIGRFADVIARFRPDAVVNAIGIVEQRDAAHDVELSLEINALFPHRLARLCRDRGARLVHISTDCVFSGEGGGYREDDVADALDLYGQTKHLGEVAMPGSITLRTSIIGLELHRRTSLVEWYLSQSGEIPGYTHAIFSGLTTFELGRVIALIVERFADLHGIFHVASRPISKYDLLKRLTAGLGRPELEIVPDAAVRCDRSLRDERFRAATGYEAPAWGAMLHELAGAIDTRDRS
jgi:dTDP-4-dehydrorhamnose reductase